MIPRFGNRERIPYPFFLYNLPYFISNSLNATSFSKQTLTRGIVIEKLHDNQYEVLVPRLGMQTTIVKKLLDQELKSGDPVWIMFEDNDINFPVALKAALDDPIPSVVPLQTIAQVNVGMKPVQNNYELFLNLEGNVHLPREILKSQRGVGGISLQSGVYNLIKGNKVVQKGKLKLETQIKYKVEASEPVELSIRTLNSGKDLTLSSIMTSGMDKSIPKLRTDVFSVPLQRGKTIAYIPDLKIDTFSETADKKQLERELEENIMFQSDIDFDFSKLTDDIYEPILELLDNLDDEFADDIEFAGSRTRLEINKNRIFNVFERLLLSIQSLNAQVGLVSSIESGIIYEPVRRYIIHNFRQADLVSRFVQLQNVVFPFLIMPDLLAIQDFMKFMSNQQLQKWFIDLDLDTNLITAFKIGKNIVDIVKLTGLGEDQITQIITKLGENIGSAILVLLLIQKLGSAFINVIGQYLDSKLTNVIEQELFDLAVIKLFSMPGQVDFSKIERFNISIEDLLGFINPSVDPRKPISDLAFHAAELLFMDDVFWYQSGNVVSGTQLLLEFFSIKNQPKIFINTENQYKKNLQIIFKRLLPIISEQEIEELSLLNFGRLGRSVNDTIEILNDAISKINILISGINDNNVFNIVDQFNNNEEAHSNPLFVGLYRVLINALNGLLQNTVINSHNIKTLLSWYRSKMLILKRDLETSRVKLFNIKMGSGFVIEIDDELAIHDRVAGQVNNVKINPRYPDFHFDTSFVPDIESPMYFSSEVEVQDFKVDEVPLIQISKFRPSPDQPFKYYILFKPTQMEFWIDGDNNVVIKANRILLEGKDDIIIRSDKNIMMIAGGGILQQSGSSLLPESVVQGVLAGNYVVAAANNIMMFSSEQIKQVALARTARKFGKQVFNKLDRPDFQII